MNVFKFKAKKKNLENEFKAYIIENKENVFMDIDITKEQYSLEDYESCILPQIKEGKNLYLSGRMPLWLLTSISCSYDSSRVFTFQPGKGFTCVSSIDEKELGTIVDGVDGIDINQYFEDKKNNNKSKVKLPAVVKKQDILSKIEGWFANFRENREKTKYLDDTIRSTVITQTEVTPSSKSIFQEELQREITEKAISHEQAPLPNTPEQEMSNFNIGG